ncbi:hypothetical protein R6Z07F_012192 [Ovis aries]
MRCQDGRAARVQQQQTFLHGPQPLGSHIWGPAEKEGDDEERLLNYLPATVEYALHMYNLTNQGRNAYKVVDVGLVFSMELEFT